MAKLSPTFFQQLDDNGDPLAGGLLYTYEAGTSTPKVTYTSQDESTPNANPIVLDAAGRADVWLDTGAYKLVLKTSADVLVDEMDNITGEASNVFGSEVTTTAVNKNITAEDQNDIIECTASLTLSLLDVATAEEGFVFTVKNSGSGSVIIDPNASETIDGAATKTIGVEGSCIVVCTGTAWITVSENYGTTNGNDMTFSGDNTYSGTSDFTGTTDFDGVVTNTAQVRWAKGADVASATALTLGTDGNYFDITGTTAIETIGTLGIGTVVKLQFDGALTLTHDATDLILPGGANITTAAGDEAEFVEYATGDWRCTNYSKANGEPIVSPVFSESYTSADQTITSGGLLTLAHGLSGSPKIIQLELECQTTDDGWAVNDRIVVHVNNSDAGTSATNALYYDGTNIYFRYSSATGCFKGANKSTGAQVTLNNANWKLIVKAWY